MYESPRHRSGVWHGWQVVVREPGSLGKLGLVYRDVSRLPIGVKGYHKLIGKRPALASGIPYIGDNEAGFFHYFSFNAFLERFAMLKVPRNTRPHVSVTVGVLGKQNIRTTMHEHDDSGRQAGKEKVSARGAVQRSLAGMVSERPAAARAKARGTVPIYQAKRARGGFGVTVNGRFA